MKNDKRKLKVYAQAGYGYKMIPTLILKGAWLEEWGFTFNVPIYVQCEEGKLVITPRRAISYIDVFEEQQLACTVAEKKGRY